MTGLQDVGTDPDRCLHGYPLDAVRRIVFLYYCDVYAAERHAMEALSALIE